MGTEQPTTSPLSEAVIIGIVIGVVVAVVLVAVLMIIVAVVSCVRTIRKKRAAKASAGRYVEVPVEDENTFSSNWTPMKSNARGNYTALPDSGNHTAL